MAYVANIKRIARANGLVDLYKVQQQLTEILELLYITGALSKYCLISKQGIKNLE